MSSIRDVYSVVNRTVSHGIEGYNVDKKYYDPLKMRE